MLAECDRVRLIRSKRLEDDQIANYVSEFDEFESQFLDEFRRLHHLNAIEVIRDKLPKIVEGKAKKDGVTVDQIDKEETLKDQINRIKPVGLPKQLLIRSPWSAAYGEMNRHEMAERTESGELAEKEQNDEEKKDNELDNVIDYILKNEHSLLRCAVYADLTRKGLYLTKGNKFGSDFLAYPADPLFVHALYLVVCLSENQQLSKTLLHTYTRLGSQVNKHVLLVRFRSDDKEMHSGKVDNRRDADLPLDQTDRRLGKEHLDHLASRLEYMVIKWQS